MYTRYLVPFGEALLILHAVGQFREVSRNFTGTNSVRGRIVVRRFGTTGKYKSGAAAFLARFLYRFGSDSGSG